MEGLWRTFVVVIVLALLGVIFTHSDTLIDSGIFLDHRIDTYPPYYTFSNQSIIINISGFDINPSTFSCNATVDSQHFPLTYDSARQDFTGNMSFNISGEFILDFVCSNGTLSDNTGGNVYRQTFLPNSDLNWWNELEQGKYKISGMKITFYINYSTEPYGLPIPNAHCTYNFSHDGLNGSAIADGNLYSFSRSFDAPGSYSYNITCDHQNHSIRRSAAAISIIEIPPMFTRTYTSMQGFYTATSFVGNLSNEELDIMYTGYGTAEDTKWYKPNQGYTERVDPGFLNGLIDGAGVFADFDRDGDYDTLLCGKKSSEFTRYYTQGLVDFSHIPTVLENVTHCSIATADLNIDGNQNIILSGSSASLPYAAVYRNEDGIFTLENTLEGLRYSSTAVLDSNNDGIDDFYMMGSPDGVNSKSYLYLYNGSELTQVNMTYNLSNGIALVGDINADAQDDLIVIGRNRSSIAGSTYGVVYLNNGTGLEHHQSLTGLTGYSTARPGGALGDVDNDGDLDLIIAGRDYSENPTSILYLNNGTHVLPSQEYIMPFNEVSINIFDIDSDGDLDIFAVGYNETIGTAAILKNNFSLNKTNTPPTAPPITDVVYNETNETLYIAWNRSTDAETPQLGISYNLRVGTQSNKDAVVSRKKPLTSNPTNGYFGNMRGKTNITLHVPEDSYYIEVTAIDSGFMESPVSSANLQSCSYTYGDNWNIESDCTYTADFNVRSSDYIRVREGATLYLKDLSIIGEGSGDVFRIDENSTLILDNVTYSEPASRQFIDSRNGTIIIRNSRINSSFMEINKTRLSVANSNISEQVKAHLSNLVFNDSYIDDMHLTDSSVFLYNTSNPPGVPLNGDAFIAEYVRIYIDAPDTHIRAYDYLVNQSTIIPSNQLVDLIFYNQSNGGTNASNYTFIVSKPYYKPAVFNLSSGISYYVSALELSGQPDYSQFDFPGTTNFTSAAETENIDNLTNGTLILPGEVELVFIGERNYTDANFTESVFMDNNSVYINLLEEPDLNGSARITFFNLSYEETPTVFLDGLNCTICSEIDYGNGNLSFVVPHFSNYSHTVNAFLRVLDTSSSCITDSTLVNISINYSQSDSGANIIGAQCNISIDGAESTNMQVSPTHIHTNITMFSSGTHNYSITCSKEDFETSEYFATIQVGEGIYDANFVEVEHFPGVGLSSVVAGDKFIYVVGESASGADAYRINITSLENESISSYPSKDGAIALMDIDNSGTLDLVVVGEGTPGIAYYKNVETNSNPTQTILSSASLEASSIDVADYNADGFQDILVCGLQSEEVTYLFKNTGTRFEQINFSINVSEGTCMFWDINGDEHLDILLNGKALDNTLHTVLLYNNGTEFTNYSNMTGTFKSSLAKADIDGDYDFDLLKDGNTTFMIEGSVFTNENLNLTYNQSLVKNVQGSNDFADINNDGYLDLISIGRNLTYGPPLDAHTYLYFNFSNQSHSLTQSYAGSISYLDYDKDSDLDVIISGFNQSDEPQSILYRNDVCAVNTLPQIPTNVKGWHNGTHVVVNWTRTGDAQGGSVTFNVRIGKLNNYDATVSGVVVKTSKPASIGYGNAAFRTNYSVHAADGCYTYQVQAIDSGGARSNWSSAKTMNYATETCDGLDNDCDGVVDNGDVCSGANDNDGSKGGSGGGGTVLQIVEEDGTVTVGIETGNEPTEPETTQDEEVIPPTEENPEQIEEQTVEESSGSSGGACVSCDHKQSITKIYDNLFDHKREWYRERGKTHISDTFYNKFIYPLDRLNLELNFDKEIIDSASGYILPGTYRIIQDDPIIGFDNITILPLKSYRVEYIIDKELTDTEVTSIDLSILFNEEDMKEKQDEFIEQVEKTAQVIDINQSVVVDYEQNKTTYTVNLDFKNESVLYNVSVYAEIPKCLVEIIRKEFIESPFDFDIINEDPLIVWHFDKIEKNKRIEYAIQTVAEEDCVNQAQSFAVARAIFVMEKRTQWMPAYKDGHITLGVIGQILIIILLVIGILEFSSYTTTPHDRVRLKSILDWVNTVEKKFRLKEEEWISRLMTAGASGAEIEEIKSIKRNPIKRLFSNLEIATEEFILFVLVFVNVLDAFEVLPGDFDLMKKFISWALLSYLFYHSSITKLLFGKRHRDIDLTLLLVFYILSIKNLIAYAIVNIHDINWFSDLVTVIVRYASEIEYTLFTIGSVLLLLIAIYISYKQEFNRPSVIMLLHMHLEPDKHIKRFFIAYFLLIFFFTTVYNLVFEWLAIAIDAPLVTLLILWYIIYIIKRKKHVSLGRFLFNLHEMTSNFYERVLQLFTERRYVALGISGLLILHILTEVGNFLFPYIVGKGDILYFGAMSDYSTATFIQLMQEGHAPIFSLVDPFIVGTSSIFMYQLQLVDPMQGAYLFLIYLLNIFFALSIFLIPGVLWLYMYKERQLKETEMYKISYSRWFLAIFLCASIVFVAAPAFTFETLEGSEVDVLLVGNSLIQGFDLQTQKVDQDLNVIPLIVGLMFSLLAFLPSKHTKYVLENFVSLGVIIFIITYILAFYWQMNGYFYNTISAAISSFEIGQALILLNLGLIYISTILFYLGGLVFFAYELRKMHEIPFMK